MGIKVEVTGPSGKTRTYKSITAAAKALSGTGRADRPFREKVSEAAATDGYIGKVQVRDVR